MNIKEILEQCPGIAKITRKSLVDILNNIMGRYDNSNYDSIDLSISYDNLDLDELDMVEIIMDLEQSLDIEIDDNVSEMLFRLNNKPNDLLFVWREQTINNIFD